MNGKRLYALYAQKWLEIGNAVVDPEWDFLEVDDQAVWNAMADSIAVVFDPELMRSSLAERLSSAECVIRQASLDTFGEELSVKEFAERSSYDS